MNLVHAIKSDDFPIFPANMGHGVKNSGQIQEMNVFQLPEKDHTGFQDFFGHVQNFNFIGNLWCKNKKVRSPVLQHRKKFEILICMSFDGYF